MLKYDVIQIIFKCCVSLMYLIVLLPKIKRKYNQIDLIENKLELFIANWSYSYEKLMVFATYQIMRAKEASWAGPSLLLLVNLFQFISKIPSIDLPFLSTNATPIPDQYDKTSCILLPVDLFQFMFKLPSIDFPLAEHQHNPHHCSISQKEIYSTA